MLKQHHLNKNIFLEERDTKMQLNDHSDSNKKDIKLLFPVFKSDQSKIVVIPIPNKKNKKIRKSKFFIFLNNYLIIFSNYQKSI